MKQTAVFVDQALHDEAIAFHREWISVGEASLVLGRHRDHLTRLCRTKLKASGRAKLFKGAPAGVASGSTSQGITTGGGGTEVWYLHRSFDQRLATGHTGLQARVAVERFEAATEKQRQLAWQRQACVEAFLERWRDSKRRVDQFLPGLLYCLSQEYPDLIKGSRSKTITRSTLYRWRSDLSKPGGVANLIYERGGQRKSNGSPECWEHFESLYCTSHQPKIAECWHQTQIFVQQHNEAISTNSGRHKLTWCSLSSCYKQLNDRIPIEKQLYNRDRKKWRSSIGPYIEQNVDRFSANACWVCDHKQLNFWVFYGKARVRPWITTWQDWKTGMIVGWCFSASPNSGTINAALHHAMSTHGKAYRPPAYVIIDNGRDFDAWTFHAQTKAQRKIRVLDKGYVEEVSFGGIYRELGIRASFSLPCNPNGKQKMERWYRTLDDQFCSAFATYCGRNPQTKSPKLQQLLLKHPQRIPQMDHARDRFSDFVTGYNHNADNQMRSLHFIGRQHSPIEAMQLLCKERRQLANPEVLDLLLQIWRKPVTCGRNGVVIAPFGVRLTYGRDPAGGFQTRLRRFKATRKQDRELLYVSYDPHDLRQVRIYDSQKRFVCLAAENIIGGLDVKVDRELLSKLMQESRTYAKSLKVVQKNHARQYLTAMEHIAAAVQLQQRAPKPTPARNVKLVQTDFDDQVQAVQSEELRALAVNGESMDDVPSLDDVMRQLARGIPSLDKLQSVFGDLALESEESDETGESDTSVPDDSSQDWSSLNQRSFD